MPILLRLLAISFGFLAAALAAGLVIVGMLLAPDLTEMGAPLNQSAFNIVLGFGFVFVSGFALLPALIIVLITETFAIRSVLAYAVGGALVGVACYFGLLPYDPATMRFDGLVRRHLEVMTGAGIVGGFVYWLIAGRRAGAWRSAPAATPPR